jgi:DedD protein
MPAREPELYKDKVEVSLDGRQIFYLFFGGSVVVGIVFVLGVLVGRRVEARGHVDRAQTHAATDPLAALDRLEGNGGLSFQGSLTGKDAPNPVEKTIDGIEKARAAKPAVPDKPVVADKPVAPAQPVAAKVVDKPKVEEAKAGPVVKPEPEVKKPEPKIEKKPDAKIEAKPEPKVEKKPEPKLDAQPAIKADLDPKPVVKPEGESKTRYTLQLSSFQDRAEAEAFLSSVKAQGFTAQITQAEVEGKGTFYRVRTGTYRSMEAATAAKGELEKSGKAASIMKL